MIRNVLHLVQEPAVDLGEIVKLVHRVAGSERRRQDKDALICRSLQLLVSREERKTREQLELLICELLSIL